MESKEVFDEWAIYAKKKKLKDRDINFESIQKNSRLKIIAITGIRRAGKTSVLILLQQMLNLKGKKAEYINLEDSRIKDNKKILDDAIKWSGDTGYLLLDEITSVNDWNGWLARTHEMLKGKLHLIVSSSRRSLIMSNKPLRGRMLSFELYPLSFKEFLQFNDIPIEKTTAGIGKIEKALDEYLVYGGFPETVLTINKTDKLNLLGSYFKDIIGLDVAEVAKENISTVELFGKYIVENTYFSASKCLNFFKSLGYKIGKQAILNLERHSQEGYLFFFAPIFSYNIKDRAQYPRKSYLGDTGFMQAISGKKDMGKLFENAVFLELKRRMQPVEEINYWKDKDGKEVDFIIRKGLKVKSVMQVVYNLEGEKTKEREVSGLISCAKELRIKEGLIITKDFNDAQVIEGVKIKFIPLWKWLLEMD